MLLDKRGKGLLMGNNALIFRPLTSKHAGFRRAGCVSQGCYYSLVTILALLQARHPDSAMRFWAPRAMLHIWQARPYPKCRTGFRFLRAHINNLAPLTVNKSLRVWYTRRKIYLRPADYRMPTSIVARMCDSYNYQFRRHPIGCDLFDRGQHKHKMYTARNLPIAVIQRIPQEPTSSEGGMLLLEHDNLLSVATPNILIA